MSEEALMAFGQLVDPSSSARRDPYPLYAQIRVAGAALRTPFGTLVTHYAAVDRTLRDTKYRAPRGWRDRDDPSGPPRFDPDGVLTRHRKLWLLFLSGEPHTRLRKLLAKVFTPKAVRLLAPRIEALSDELVAPILARGSAEVMADLATRLPVTVITELLGLPEELAVPSRAWSLALAPTLDVLTTPEEVAAAERAAVEWDTALRPLITRRRRHPEDKLLDAMLGVEDDGDRFSDDEVVANVTLLFAAGHETTTNLIGNGLFALLRQPDQLARWQANPAIGESAVEELLRFDSPVQFAGRVSDVPTEIEGIPVAPGSIVQLALGAANHDEHVFSSPDVLDLGRQPRPLSFGGGAHYCLGAVLARAEALATLGALVARAEWIELAGDPIWGQRLNLRGLQRLPIQVRPR
jgi:cytochrome P450